MSATKNHHLLSILDLNRDDLRNIFLLASKGEQVFREYSSKFSNRFLATLFLEPSTRTRLLHIPAKSNTDSGGSRTPFPPQALPIEFLP